MPAETLPPKNENLDLESFYSSKALFFRLSDGIPHAFPLENNWKDIRIHDYDPITDIQVKVKTGAIERASGETGERPEMGIRFEAILETRTQKGYLSMDRLAKMFDKQGLNLDYVPGKPEAGSSFTPPGYFVSNNEAEPKFVIKFMDTQFSIFSMYLIFPQNAFPLKDVKNFEESQSAFLGIIKNVAEAIYDYEDKKFPPTRLEFRAKETNTPFYAVCPYCHSNYFADRDPTCPNCGASEPKYISKR